MAGVARAGDREHGPSAGNCARPRPQPVPAKRGDRGGRREAPDRDQGIGDKARHEGYKLRAMSNDPLADPEPLIRRIYAYVAYRIGDGPDAEDVTSATIER